MNVIEASVWIKRDSSVFRLAVAAFLFATVPHVPGQAQTRQSPPPPGTSRVANEVPSAGDPQVAFLFLRFHEALLQDIRGLGKSQDAVNSERAMAASMNLSVADFEAISSAYEQIAPLLQALDKEGMAYRDRVIVGQERANTKTLAQFQGRRNAVLESI